MTIGRNDPCPCSSGKKFKKCCAAKRKTTTAGLKAAIRMKGGISFDPGVNAFRAIVHSWDNADCIGEPQEWRSTETFPSEDAAMDFYKANIRPGLERLIDAVTMRTPGHGHVIWSANDLAIFADVAAGTTTVHYAFCVDSIWGKRIAAANGRTEVVFPEISLGIGFTNGTLFNPFTMKATERQ